MISFRRKKDSFYVILKKKYSFRRDSNPPIHRLRGEPSTTGLSDLLMNGHKISIISSTKCFVYKSIKYTQLSENANCEQFWIRIKFKFKKNKSVKLAAMLTLGSTDVFLIKKKDTSGGNPGCSKKNYFPLKMSQNFLTWFYYYLKSTKHVESINGYILLCMCLWHTYEISSTSVRWLFLKTTLEWLKVGPVRKLEGCTLNLKSIV